MDFTGVLRMHEWPFLLSLERASISAREAFIYIQVLNIHNLLFVYFFMRFSEFQKLWRSVPVDSIDEEKIDEYLKKQGISSMQETGPKKVVSENFSAVWRDFFFALNSKMPNMSSVFYITLCL